MYLCFPILLSSTQTIFPNQISKNLFSFSNKNREVNFASIFCVCVLYMYRIGIFSSNFSKTPLERDKWHQIPLNSFEKSDNCIVILVNDFNASQTCAKCFNRSPRNPRSHRFQMCRECHMHPHAELPKIVRVFYIGDVC